jgi:hypothetical protein
MLCITTLLPAIHDPSLPSLGGGAFGNDERWIIQALRRALDLIRHYDLHVRIVSCGNPTPAMTILAREWA